MRLRHELEKVTDEELARDKPFIPEPEAGSPEALALAELAAAAEILALEEAKKVEEGGEEVAEKEEVPVELKSIPLEFNLKLSTGRKSQKSTIMINQKYIRRAEYNCDLCNN